MPETQDITSAVVTAYQEYHASIEKGIETFIDSKRQTISEMNGRYEGVTVIQDPEGLLRRLENTERRTQEQIIGTSPFRRLQDENFVLALTGEKHPTDEEIAKINQLLTTVNRACR